MKHILYALIGLSLLSSPAPAQDKVLVKKGAGARSSIDWSGFSAASDPAAQTFWQTLQSDLLASGWFVKGPPAGAELALTGQAAGGVSAECRVTSRLDQRNYLAKSYRADPNGARRMAHQAADDILTALGHKPFFTARIALVGNRTGCKELYMCDADGKGLIQLTRDGKPGISPNWTPDGKSIVYTSFLKGYADLYKVELASGSRARISSFPGVNTGGAVSPDGRDIAEILSKDGNPELYVRGMAGGGLTRLTNTQRGGEASPSWSPDGRRIVYVSDQAGSPQLYAVGRDGGAPARLTSRGAQNVAPDWGSNGWIAYASLLGGHFQIFILNPDSLETRQITSDGYDYEDPSWAPDGRHIACGRAAQYKSKVVLLDAAPANPDPPLALTDYPGDWYSPAWSPKN
jgi:TolB protein